MGLNYYFMKQTYIENRILIFVGISSIIFFNTFNSQLIRICRGY